MPAQRATSKARVGELIDACAIDLPPNDVVESIEFEKFFVLNARLAEFQRPLTLTSAWASMRSDALSSEDVAMLGSGLPIGAPFSNKLRDWEFLASAERVKEAKWARAAKTGKASPPAGESAAPFIESATGYSETTATDALSAEVRAARGPNISEYRLAFYLPYTQEWQLLGYSRGRMVSSLTLGPQEEQTIEIFKWDRLSRTLDSTTSFEFEQTSESSGTRRDTTDISRDMSRQSGFELTANGKVGFKIDVVTADFSTNTNAKTALNDVEKNARQSITEATSRAATNVRSSRTLKVVETRESGEETRVTRKLRNQNTCHTLTTTFFEILANYKVSTYLRTDAIRLVVLLKSSELSQIKAFNRRFVRSHERTLTLGLLDSTLTPGFEAARYLDARDRACAILCSGCDCGADTGVGARDQEWEALKAALVILGGAVASLSTGVVLPVSVALVRFEPPGGAGPGAQGIQRYLFLKALEKHAPRLLANLGGLNLASGAVTPALANSAMATIDAIAAEDLGALKTPEGSVKDSVGWEIWGLLFLVFTEPIATTISFGALIGAIGGLGPFNDGGLVSAIADVKAKYTAWQAHLAEQRARDEKQAALERIAKEERSLRVLDAFPLRATADAEERLEALLDHLNDPRNIDHYRFAVWNERAGSTDPQLLALALAGVTEGAPVGVVGDDLAVPLRIPGGSVLEAFFEESIEDLISMSPRDEDDHILPTAALYAEAIPGECCACEENIVRREELELKERELENELLDAELERRKAKIKANDFSGATTTEPFRVEVTNVAPATKPTAPGP
jgi:hypothetical protein